MPVKKDIHILIVDDSSLVRTVHRKMLEQIGFRNLTEADDGTNALTILNSETVDLVITDWNMPQMSGLQLLQAMQANTALKPIPVLMVTSEDEQQEVLKAIKSGVTYYILKPTTAEKFKERITKILL